MYVCMYDRTETGKLLSQPVRGSELPACPAIGNNYLKFVTNAGVDKIKVARRVQFSPLAEKYAAVQGSSTIALPTMKTFKYTHITSIIDINLNCTLLPT